MFNYSFQYNKWHQDTEESKLKDVAQETSDLRLHNLLPSTLEDNVLEIGCGMGRMLLALKEAGFHNLSGVDIDDSQITVAKKTGLNVYLSDGIDFLRKSTEIYDAIYCMDVLEHLKKEDVLIFLQEVYKHLSSKGFFALRVPNGLAATMYFRYDDFTHHCSYTVNSLEFLLRNAGFSHMTHRPQYQESHALQQAKKYYADLLQTEFGWDQPPILTNNIVTIAFKESYVKDQYINSAPELINRYEEKTEQELAIEKLQCEIEASKLMIEKLQCEAMDLKNETRDFVVVSQKLKYSKYLLLSIIPNPKRKHYLKKIKEYKIRGSSINDEK